MPTAFERHRAGANREWVQRRAAPQRASQPGGSATRPAWWAVWLGCGLLVAGAGWWWSRRPPPQLPDDPAVFKTTSALWTAVGSRNPQAVAACQQRLQAYRQTGRLEPSAARRLERIIQHTQSGDWDTAAYELYQFMLGQRRQGNPPRAVKVAP